LNAQSLKDRLNKLCNDLKIDKNIILKFYIFERFIERLSKSKYKDKFIIKGGYYLATVVGFKTRTTIDIDYSITNINLEAEVIKEVIDDIISIELDDNTKLLFEKIDTIRDDEEYSGYRVSLRVQIDNIRGLFHVDIVAGDIITPYAITYKYMKLFDNNIIEMQAYTFETILAEKIETILTRGTRSSRMKDYYDVFIIKNLFYSKLSKDNITNAFINTFRYRKSEKYLENSIEILDSIKLNKNIWKNWDSYQDKNNIKKSITFESIIDLIQEIIEEHIDIKDYEK